jgi:hypothetical protein
MKFLAVMSMFCLVMLEGCATHAISQYSDDVVELRLFRPFADQVFLYCSADEFKPQQANANIWWYWTVKVNYGKDFSYFYIVDGQVVTPDCDLREHDDFGSYNCLHKVNI